MYGPNSMADHQEDTGVSPRPWRRSEKGSAGSRKETTSISVSTATPAQPVAAREKRVGVLCISTTSGLRSREQPSRERDPSLKDLRNRYRVIAVDYFTTWPEAYDVPKQEASTVAEALVTNFFCHFGVLRELRSDQGCNFESRLMQMLQRLGVRKTGSTPCTRSRMVWCSGI
jgi:hypothetical protein